MPSTISKQSLPYTLYDTPRYARDSHGNILFKIVGHFDQAIANTFQAKALINPALFIDGYNIYILDSLRNKSPFRIQSFIQELNNLIYEQKTLSDETVRYPINVFVNNPEKFLCNNSINIITTLADAAKSKIDIHLKNMCREPSAWGTFIQSHNGVLTR